jgi:hypothetical protein
MHGHKTHLKQCTADGYKKPLDNSFLGLLQFSNELDVDIQKEGAGHRVEQGACHWIDRFWHPDFTGDGVEDLFEIMLRIFLDWELVFASGLMSMEEKMF